ncbi:MAG: hypothetical protein K9H49_04705 [Bacteroidales bacterium]|nr:hypothetical protein [Bacteroidales bacterium]MCF8389116.1 hypothetical protein [Bacteroidales bacterium]
MIREECSEIGFIAKPHGIEGNLIVRLNGNFADEIEPGEPLFVEHDGTLVPFFILEISPLENRAIVKLEFVNSEPEAKKLVSRKVFAKIDFSDIGQADASFFESFRIFDKNSNREGIILEYISEERNPLYRTEFDSKELLIPATSDFIVSVDKERKIVYMNLPSGLLDI